MPPPRGPHPAAGTAAAGLLIAAALLCPTGGIAQESDAAGELPRVERAIAESDTLRRQLDEEVARLNREVSALRAESISASVEIMRQHAVLLEIERAMLVLSEEVAERLVRLDEQRDKLAVLLGGLTRLSRVPPEAMVARPSAPVDTLRTATLLRAAMPAIEAEARVLRRQLDDLAMVRLDLADRREAAEAKRGELDLRIGGLNDLVARREALLAETATRRSDVERRLQTLADEADSLRDLLARIEEEAARDAAAAPPDDPAVEEGREVARGEATALAALPVIDGVILPVSGEIAVRYGQPDAFGESSRGLTLIPYPGAPVVAPLDGEVRFSGIFKGYGELLILEHTGGYHSLISGFGRIDARVGQQVLAGEPVGVTALPQIGGTDDPSVYFEFRSNGQPVNPVQGLAMARERLRG
ncbi:MAG: peptidoglycan DD-metalloendopeptidase family protein [Inquilinus sp.]|nr:peptidoglycan DD-metalloendopeptidase family protein [Inquilinus sp.]